MATRISESIVVPQPIFKVWPQVRDWLNKDLFSDHIKVSEVQEGKSSDTVGCFRKVVWKDGQEYRYRLLELSDQHYLVSFEATESTPPLKISGQIISISLKRVTLVSDRPNEQQMQNQNTLVSWETDFSADVTSQVVKEFTAMVRAVLFSMRKKFAEMK